MFISQKEIIKMWKDNCDVQIKYDKKQVKTFRKSKYLNKLKLKRIS